MTTGHRITLPKTAKIKDGRISLPPVYGDISSRIRAKKSKKITVKRGKHG